MRSEALLPRANVPHPSGAAADAISTMPNDDASTEALRARRRTALVVDHAQFGWRMLRRFGVAPDDVDDACQELMLVASNKIDSIEPGRERAFLIGTALRITARLRAARAARHETSDDAIEDRADGAASAEQLLDRRRARAVLDRCLDELSPDLRAVFVLFELEDETMADIARTLELPPGTVASRLRRAREVFFRAAARWKKRLGGDHV